MMSSRVPKESLFYDSQQTSREFSPDIEVTNPRVILDINMFSAGNSNASSEDSFA